MIHKDILRMVDAIHREKHIDKDIIFKGLESAIESVGAKQFPYTGEIDARVDRETGDLTVRVDGDPIQPHELGRIAAQNVYQIIMQKIKEAEKNVLYLKYKQLEGSLVSGAVRRIERNTIWVNIGEVTAILPAREQVRGEKFQLGERIRCVVHNVEREGGDIVVILSRSSEDLVKALFKLEIPEVENGTILIKNIVRKPGTRTKIAVHPTVPEIDCIGACVGVKGSRIWAVIHEINEKIDIIQWNEDPHIYISNALSPAEIDTVELVPAISYARVIVQHDQIPLAIGKRGLNIKLSSHLTGWDLDVFDTAEIQKLQEQGLKDIRSLPYVGDKTFSRIKKRNIKTLEELIWFGKDKLAALPTLSESIADSILEKSRELIKERRQQPAPEETENNIEDNEIE